MDEPLVTLGFRCSPSLKSQLNINAKNNKITLSQFVNELVSDADSKIRESANKIVALRNEIRVLRLIIENYESPILKKLYEKHKDKPAVIQDAKGEKETIIIKSLLDLHHVIIKSFK
jgi:hypothetical protein